MSAKIENSIACNCNLNIVFWTIFVFMIYLAPLQGFTDFVYRKVYSSVFSGVDAFFIPYITTKNNELLRKYKNEILPENNPQLRVVPQVLVNNSVEMLFLSKLLEDAGYSEINLNLGCPYPMVTNRGKGAGLLNTPDKLQVILSDFYEKSNLQLSVKLRAGLKSSIELESVVPVLNRFPLKEVIFHPRVASQLYSGEILDESFIYMQENLKHNLVFNGDIVSVSDLKKRQEQFPDVQTWMIGRGILMNPFLPMEIKDVNISEKEKIEKLVLFHQRMWEEYLQTMDNEGNALNKMKQFWYYFSYSFQNQHKVFKLIKKAANTQKYRIAVQKIFSEFI